LDWSNNWDKDEKGNTHRFRSDSTSYSGSYPYLPKKLTIVIVAAAILMFVGIINGIINPGPPILPTDEQIDAMSCKDLHEFLVENNGNNEIGMYYFVEKATTRFLDECSSYG